MTAPYTKSPKWVFKAIAQGLLKPRQVQVLAFFVDQVCGFNDRAGLRSSFAQLAEATGIHPNHIRPTLKGLMEIGALTANEHGVTVPQEQPNQLFSSNQISCEKQPNQLRKTTKSVASTVHKETPSAGSSGQQENIQENSQEKYPYSPQGDDTEIPFTEDPPPPTEPGKDDDLEEWFESCWVLVKKKAGKKKAHTAAKYVAKRDRPKVLAALQVYNASEDWEAPGRLRFYLHFATMLNQERWREFAPEEAPANPYENKPWGPIWTQAGFPATEVGVMNFCAAVAQAGDPYEARRIFQAEGFEAAVIYAIERRKAG